MPLTQTDKPGAPQPATPAPTGTYAAAYARLAAIADRLKASGATSIDTLVDDVRAAFDQRRTVEPTNDWP